MKKLLARERMKKAQKIILQVLAALAVIILIISISLHKKETSYTQEELLMDTSLRDRYTRALSQTNLDNTGEINKLYQLLN